MANNNKFNRSENYNNKKERPKPYVLNLPITLKPSVNGGRDYTDHSASMALIHLNEQILPYINIPLVMDRSILLDDSTKHGTVNIGFIKSYNDDDKTLEVGIFNKNIDRVKELNVDGDLFVKVNCIANDDQLSKFVSFEAYVENQFVNED